MKCFFCASLLWELLGLGISWPLVRLHPNWGVLPMSNLRSCCASCGALTAWAAWGNKGCEQSQNRVQVSEDHFLVKLKWMCWHEMKYLFAKLLQQVAGQVSMQYPQLSSRSFMLSCINSWNLITARSITARSFFKNPENQKRLDEFEASAKGSGHDYRAPHPDGIKTLAMDWPTADEFFIHFPCIFMLFACYFSMLEHLECKRPSVTLQGSAGSVVGAWSLSKDLYPRSIPRKC